MSYLMPTSRATTRDTVPQGSRQSGGEKSRAAIRDITANAVPPDAQVAFTGTLHVKQVQGRFGPFLVGTLYTAIGAFAVRDERLKTLAEGEFEGVFHVAELPLYSYRAYGEQRTTIRAIIGGYHLCDTSVVEDDYANRDAANDGFLPYDDDCYIPEADMPMHGDTSPGGTTLDFVADNLVTADNRGAQAVTIRPGETGTDTETDDVATPEAIDIAAYEDENVRLLRSYLAGTEREDWRFGEPYKIDTTIGRPHIAKCRCALDALGYALDTRQQLWLPADDGGAL